MPLFYHFLSFSYFPPQNILISLPNSYIDYILISIGQAQLNESFLLFLFS